MAYASWSVIAGETPTAAKWNIIGSNAQDANDRLDLIETMQETTVASDTTPNPDVSYFRNLYTITALAGNATFADPGGSPNQGDVLIVRIKDDGSARTLGWNSVYRSIITLPTTTTASKTLYVGFIYNDTDSKWDCIAVMEED